MAGRSRSTGRSSSTSGSIRSSAPAWAGRSCSTTGFAYEFWRFAFVKQEIGQYAQTFLEFPPKKGATFNLEALKAELEKKMEALKSKHGD